MFAVLLSTHALNYTSFPGLVQAAAESECGVSLHGHRKCSQAGCLLVNCDFGESALEGGYTFESPSPEKQRGTRAMFTLTCNANFTERRGYSHLKEEALDRTMWRARFGRGFEPVVRQTTK